MTTVFLFSDYSPQLYVTFWALSMFDLYVPSERYEQELNKLKQQLAQLEDNKDMVWLNPYYALQYHINSDI